MTIYLGLPRLLRSVTVCPELSSSSWIWWWLVSCPWPCFPSTDVGETSASTCGLSNFPLTLHHRGDQTKTERSFFAFLRCPMKIKVWSKQMDKHESSESCYSICTYCTYFRNEKGISCISVNIRMRNVRRNVHKSHLRIKIILHLYSKRFVLSWIFDSINKILLLLLNNSTISIFYMLYIVFVNVHYTFIMLY